MRCVKPIMLDVHSTGHYTSFPCGKCIACRIAIRKEWTMRMIHELCDWDDAVFLTLTYADDALHVTSQGYPTLCKRDLQLFFKRVRRRGKDIKYFACGEYGSITGRPHYHAIVYGLGLSDEDKSVVMAAWPHCDWEVESIATRSFGLVSAESCGYVAGYIHDKLSGERLREYEAITGCTPCYRVSSHGLGRGYCDVNIDRLLRSGLVTSRGNKHSIPRYYLKRMGITSDMLEADYDNSDIADLTGISDVTIDDLYHDAALRDIYDSYIERDAAAREQRERNIQAKLALKARDYGTT